MTTDRAPATGDRRPIASRNTALARRISTWLVKCSASPDGISLAGMGAGVLAGALLAATALWPAPERLLWLGALGAIQLRLLCNLFDGMVAIESGRSSPVGELYNDLPDRISDSATLIGFGFAAGGEPVLGFVAALLAMLTAYIRVLGKATGAGSDFRGPMAKQQRMFVVSAAALWLGVAPAAWRPAAWGLQLPGMALAVIAAGSLWTALRRLRSIAAVLRQATR